MFPRPVTDKISKVFMWVTRPVAISYKVLRNLSKVDKAFHMASDILVVSFNKLW